MQTGPKIKEMFIKLYEYFLDFNIRYCLYNIYSIENIVLSG